MTTPVRNGAGNLKGSGNCRSAAVAASLLRDGITVRLQVAGNSMRPWIKPGDTVTISPCRMTDVRPGDIVFYERPSGRHVLHRAMRVLRSPDGNRIEAGGDWSPNEAECVTSGQLLGLATEIRREGQKVRHLARGTGRLRLIYPVLSRLRRRMRAGPGLRQLLHRRIYR